MTSAIITVASERDANNRIINEPQQLRLMHRNQSCRRCVTIRIRHDCGCNLTQNQPTCVLFCLLRITQLDLKSSLRRVHCVSFCCNPAEPARSIADGNDVFRGSKGAKNRHRLRKGLDLSLGSESVADTLLSQNVPRAGGIGFQLSAQAGDEDSQVVVFL